MSMHHHYQLVAQAIDFIRTERLSQPSLNEIADALNISPHHLQRVFTEWAGVSPKRFLQYLTKESAKQALQMGQSTTEAFLDNGLSSGGRLYDLMVSWEAMTPGEISQRGVGLAIHYGTANTPFGPALIAWTPRGICALQFVDDDQSLALTQIKADWPDASFSENEEQAQILIDRCFSPRNADQKVQLLLRGSPFQLKVWEALIKSPPDRPLSYSQLAEKAGSPKAQRAIGSAMAANRIGLLIPCHRVIRNDGDVGQYRWGTTRKQAILAWERSHFANE